MAADASHVYWADEGDETAGNGTISEASPDGSSPHAIVTGQTTPTGVAVGPSHLYWASNGDGTVNQASPDGSSPHVIVTGQNQPTWMAVSPAAPDLSFSPAPFDYGSVPPGQTATQTFTLTNSGQAATGPLTVTLTDPAAFAVTADACSAVSLGPGQTCSITVRFTSAAGAMTATLTAASTDPVAIATDALTGEAAPAIYWANAGDHTGGAGAIWTANLDGSSPARHRHRPGRPGRGGDRFQPPLLDPRR